MEEKTCKHCGITKIHKSFYRRGKYLSPYCKDCEKQKAKDRRLKDPSLTKQKDRENYQRNREKNCAKAKEYRAKNKERISQRERERYQANKERLQAEARQRYYENKEKILAQKKKHRQENNEEVNKKQREYQKGEVYKNCRNKWRNKQRKENPLFQLKENMRCRVWQYLKNGKSKSTEKLIGCTWEELKSHIESLWLDNMTWDNYGDWHIDHIMPLASANSLSEIEKLCHYSNLQPLWASDNLSKGAKTE
jgi:hypothetical protein